MRISQGSLFWPILTMFLTFLSCLDLFTILSRLSYPDIFLQTDFSGLRTHIDHVVENLISCHFWNLNLEIKIFTYICKALLLAVNAIFFHRHSLKGSCADGIKTKKVSSFIIISFIFFELNELEIMWLLWMCKQVYSYTDERLYCIKVQTVQRYDWQLTGKLIWAVAVTKV